MRSSNNNNNNNEILQEIPVVVFVGKIGVGKTSIAKNLKREIEKYHDNLNISVLLEPVEEWKSINLLNNFYSDMKRFAYSFQQYAFASRLNAIKDVNIKETDLILSDGTIFMDKYCFAEMLNESGFISDTEMEWYNSTFKHWQKLVPLAAPSLIVYLKLDNSNSVLKRISKRNRTEETNISTDYLDKLQAKLEKMLTLPMFEGKVLVVDASKSKEEITREIYMYLLCGGGTRVNHLSIVKQIEQKKKLEEFSCFLDKNNKDSDNNNNTARVDFVIKSEHIIFSLIVCVIFLFTFWIIFRYF